MTVVMEQRAPSFPALPGVDAEYKEILRIVPATWLHSVGRDTPTTVETTLALRQSAIVHFGCHGIQDPKNPLQSGLLFRDRRLQVSDLMRNLDSDTDRSLDRGMSLAFLSAYETAKGDAKSPDEAMHLAATLLFAGFRGVVATMWCGIFEFNSS
jgi:CHAT domain-containing protein